MKVLSFFVVAYSILLWIMPLSYAEPVSGESIALQVKSASPTPGGEGLRPGILMALSKGGDGPSAQEGRRPIEADKPDFGISGKKNYFNVFLGASYWSNLGDIQPLSSVVIPDRYGEIKEWGYGIEGGYHRLVGRWFGHDVRIGVDMGFYYHENEKEYQVVILPSGRTLDGEIVARGFYLTPSLRWVFGAKDSTRLLLGAGIGYYRVDFVEQLDDGTSSDSFFENDTVGGYLSVGLGIPLIGSKPEALVLTFEGKVHYADFGDLGEFAPGAGDLKGPIYMFQVGLTF
jgi:hypothetical protein